MHQEAATEMAKHRYCVGNSTYRSPKEFLAARASVKADRIADLLAGETLSMVVAQKIARVFGMEVRIVPVD
jgi:hypothetical protein